jgi:hypothetical protein
MYKIVFLVKFKLLKSEKTKKNVSNVFEYSMKMRKYSDALINLILHFQQIILSFNYSSNI